MAFPLITDPYFYAVAIPAVLLLGWVIGSCRTSRSRLPRQWTVPP